MTSESFKAYDLTPKGEGETSFKAVWMANRSERALYLARALRRSVTDFATVLFSFLVKEFREGAAKKQFRFIYDEYLTDAVERMDAAIEGKKLGKAPRKIQSNQRGSEFLDLTMNFNFTYRSLMNIMEMNEIVNHLLGISKSKSFLTRWMDSSARVIPNYCFDELAYELLVDRGKDPVAEKYDIKIKSEPAFEDPMSILTGELSQTDSGFKSYMENIKKTLIPMLKKAGFDVEKLGLTKVEINLYNVKIL